MPVMNRGGVRSLWMPQIGQADGQSPLSPLPIERAPMDACCYTVSDIATVDALKSRLAATFSRVTATVEQSTLEVLDSFDWRLHHHGWQVNRRKDRFEIINRADGRVISDTLASGSARRRFWWDFPPSDFSRHLENRLAMRALIPMAKIQQRLTRFDVRNQDDKIVTRVAIESLTAAGHPQPVIQCRVTAMGGYPKAFETVTDLVKTLALPPAETSPVVALLEKMGAAPGGYSSKINIALPADMPAEAAVRHVLANLVSTIATNLPGIEQDIDSEFLHDFRVAVRRARSLLGQFKAVLDPDQTAHLQRLLKSMGAISGAVRDLDVVLLQKTHYLNRLPECLNPGAVQLFRMLQRKRDRARQRMIRQMAGRGFKAALSDLNTFVQGNPAAAPQTPEGARPILEVAQPVIYNRYRRIISKGRRISDHTADGALHALRIQCKKLRYLLEFFAALFPENQIGLLVKQLKQLQENLGDFNDLSVQQAFFSCHLETIEPRTEAAVILAAATGGLIAGLSLERKAVRSQFLRVFEAFAQSENRKRFKQLFT